MSGICPSCGEEFDKPGLHWSHGTCPYPEISPIQEAVFEGLLMGDGSIPKQSGAGRASSRTPRGRAQDRTRESPIHLR